MRVTVIIPDRIVQKDGLAFKVDLPACPENWHAIQFYEDGRAELECRNSTYRGDEAATMIAPFVKAWEAAKTARDFAVSEAAAKAAHAATVPATGTDPV